MADTNERLQQAIAAARAGKTSEAKVLAERLVEENPDNPHALFLLGMLVDSQDEQREYMQRVLDLDPDHKAANKRMAQLGPVEEPEPLAEEPVEELVEARPQEFEAEPQELEAEPQEFEAELLDETIVAAAVVDQDVLIGEEAVKEMEEPPFELVDEASVEELDEQFFEAEEEPDIGLAETLVGAAVVGEALEPETPEVEDEIPDWLFEEARSEEELLEIDEAQLWTDEPVPVEEDLPDWLQEDKSEEFADIYSEEQLISVPEEPEPAAYEEDSEALAAAVGAGMAADIDLFEDESFEAVEEPVVEPAPAERPKKKKSANRGLEILLIVLIIIALIVVGVLGYLIISPPV